MTEQTDTPERMHSRKNDHIRICATEDVESSGDAFPGTSIPGDASTARFPLPPEGQRECGS